MSRGAGSGLHVRRPFQPIVVKASRFAVRLCRAALMAIGEQTHRP
jgi:hypothetical protein